MSASRVAALLAKTQKAAAGGKYERYKSTGEFDDAVQNPQWDSAGPTGNLYPPGKREPI